MICELPVQISETRYKHLHLTCTRVTGKTTLQQPFDTRCVTCDGVDNLSNFLHDKKQLYTVTEHLAEWTLDRTDL